MKSQQCQGCYKQFGLNELYSVLGQTLCTDCGDRKLESLGGRKVPEGSVIRLTDPTICRRCGADNGSMELLTIAGAPLCDACTGAIRKATSLPTWLKAGLAAAVVLVAVAFARNWRFFQAHQELQRAQAAMKQGDLDSCDDLVQQAAGHVPEVSNVTLQADFLRGMRLMTKRQFAEAVPLLERVSAAEGPESKVRLFVLLAKAQMYLDAEEDDKAALVAAEMKQAFPGEQGTRRVAEAVDVARAFDGKDWDRFLELSESTAREEPESAMAKGQLASALACKYAATGDIKFKTAAMEELEKAKKLATPDGDLQEYQARIMHRLESREIISRKEYNRRFRNGQKG